MTNTLRASLKTSAYPSQPEKGRDEANKKRVFRDALNQNAYLYAYYLNMKDFKKYYSIPAQPEEVYLALTLPATIQLWSGDYAEMSDEPGSEFLLWDGSIVGKNLEFEPGKKIVQQWYFGEDPDEGEKSIVTIKLHPDAQGTSVELKHVNIPDEDYDDIVDGWNTIYFGSLREFYE